MNFKIQSTANSSTANSSTATDNDQKESCFYNYEGVLQFGGSSFRRTLLKQLKPSDRNLYSNMESTLGHI